MFKSRSVLVAALAILAFAAACGAPAPTPETVIVKETVIVEKVVTKEVEKVVTKEVEKVVEVPVVVTETVEVEKEVTVEVTPTPSPTATVVPTATAKTEVQVQAVPNLLATFVFTHGWDLRIEGSDEINHVEYTYIGELVTDTLTFRDPISPVLTVEVDYGYMTVTEQGASEPSLQVVIDDQALAVLLFEWAQKEAQGLPRDFNVDVSNLHWAYRNERSTETGNNISFDKNGGLDINEAGQLELKFGGVRPMAGLISQAVILGPDMNMYGEALEKEAINAWAVYHSQLGLEYEPLGVYAHFK